MLHFVFSKQMKNVKKENQTKRFSSTEFIIVRFIISLIPNAATKENVRTCCNFRAVARVFCVLPLQYAWMIFISDRAENAFFELTDYCDGNKKNWKAKLNFSIAFYCFAVIVSLASFFVRLLSVNQLASEWSTGWEID